MATSHIAESNPPSHTNINVYLMVEIRANGRQLENQTGDMHVQQERERDSDANDTADFLGVPAPHLCAASDTLEWLDEIAEWFCPVETGGAEAHKTRP